MQNDQNCLAIFMEVATIQMVVCMRAEESSITSGTDGER